MTLIEPIESQVRTTARSTSERGAIMSRRDALFRESAWEKCQRVVLGTAWALRPIRLRKLLPLARLWLRDLARNNRALPHADVPAGRDEFAGIVHDLSPATLIAAYARGLYPKGHFGPLKWVSPPTRCVLDFKDFHMSRRLRSIMRQQKYRVTFDRDFEGVIKACAGRRQGRLPLTWITPKIMHAYADLHDAGYAHSFEVWNEDGELAGGGYGVAIGGTFVIESQFSRESNTSKIGFSVLIWHLARWGFVLGDNKLPTPAILQMGFITIPRAAFLRRLDDALALPGKSGKWQVEADPKGVADWRPCKEGSIQSPAGEPSQAA